ncbi:hypothetical protein PBDP_4029 [Pseudomonas sp. St290]|nr:hypothetical protein PBDP_4029 [Pseudomonas sp. St290]
MDKPRLGRWRRVALAVVELGLAFGRVEQRQFTDALRRVGHDCPQQVLPMPGHARDRLGAKQVGGINQPYREPFAVLHGFQGQVELRRVRIPAQPLDFQRTDRPLARRALGPVVEHHLEQRAVAQVALRLQRLDQLLERQLLVRLGTQGCLLHLLQQGTKRILALDIAVEHLGVDEKADQALGLDPVTVGRRHADTNIVLAAVAMQQRLERGQQKHEQADAFALGHVLEVASQYRIDGKFQPRAAIAHHRRTGEIGRQFQHRLLATQACGPVFQLAFTLARFHPVPLPDGVVGVLDRQRRQLRHVALAEGGVAVDQFLDHHLHRPAIGNDVVQGHDQHMVIRRQPQQARAQQRPLLQVEELAGFGFDQLAQLGFVRPLFQRVCLQAHWRRRVHLLHDLLALGLEGGAQALVTRHQRRETLLQRSDVQRPAQAQGRRHVVGRALGVQLPQEPLAFLGK